MEAPNEVVGPINLGNPGEYTIKQLAELTIEMVGNDNKIIYEPLPPDDPTRRQPDITLARKYLDWEPTVSLRDGLSKTIEWFKTINADDYRPPTPNF
jgi:UDP-glucuronate decarboxylase